MPLLKFVCQLHTQCAVCYLSVCVCLCVCVCVCVFKEKAAAQRLQLRHFCERGHRCLSHSDHNVRQQVGQTGSISWYFIKQEQLNFPSGSCNSPRSSTSGFPGYLWRSHGSFLPATRVGSHLLWSIALHPQSQTAEGAVDLCMHACLCWTRLWQPVQWWDLSLFTWILFHLPNVHVYMFCCFFTLMFELHCTEWWVCTVWP